MEHADWDQAWNDAMGFGIPELDAADRRLGALAHDLNRAIADGWEMEALQRLLRQLLLEAIDHFEYEERVLSEHAYPLPQGHAALHLQMRAELEHAIEVLRDVKARAMWAEYGFLVTQLIAEHFRQETIKYRNYLRSAPPADLHGEQ